MLNQGSGSQFEIVQVLNDASFFTRMTPHFLLVKPPIEATPNPTAPLAAEIHIHGRIRIDTAADQLAAVIWL